MIGFVLWILCLFAVPQSATNYCDPPAPVKEELKKLAKLRDEDLAVKTSRERQLAILQEMLKKYPGDFHVHRRYQDVRRNGFFVDTDALLVEYRQQMEKTANDPIAVYLYARALVGTNTKEAIQLLTSLAERSPEFPWSHLQLAEIYQYPNFRDVAKSTEQFKQWMAKCPDAREGLSLISRSGDKQIMTAVEQRLRARLESSTDNDDLAYWNTLWTIEFKLTPVTGHAQVRQKITEDLKRIRANNENSRELLQALQDGYKQLGDKTAQRAAEDELIRLFPRSGRARQLVQSRYFEEHPYPKGEVSEAQMQAYQQAMVQATGEWLKQWPDDENTWSRRVGALSQLEKSSPADVEAAYDGYLKAHEQGGAFYTIPPLELSLARLYLKRGLNLQRVPAMIQKGIAEVEKIDKRHTSDLYSLPDDVEGGNLLYVRLEGWPLLAEAYARLKQPAKAQEVLDQLAALAKQKEPRDPSNVSQKNAFVYSQTVYWQAVANVSEIEQRKLDALMAYQMLLSFREKPSKTSTANNKDELLETTKRLWKELGGTEQGWRAYVGRPDVSNTKFETAEVSTWDTKNSVLADFELVDLQGRKWSLADLKGKVAFINLWATWCGPCREELPYVQKLRERLKDRTDVLVLTVNTDENVGMVEPFMKENKFTFPVLLGQSYAETQGVNSIPRNWVVSFEGKLMFEGIGFGDDGDEWIKKVMEMIDKVKGK